MKNIVNDPNFQKTTFTDDFQSFEPSVQGDPSSKSGCFDCNVA